ncbi:1-acyl-sn-glycerol-3-phosphate acyltransferase (plasmid) [Pontibacillus sp. ALD_SL1]|uniref:lysophospholipid acyltransferase family protein n=1 Tax=Pontibacillus sp. ALD_SL1 TaxID=2777185 RepID=UPI001A960467|nr:lysophospholipid acyltransferase family protein [Pontibacillus sp. ALD_SL1]QST02275.1 1-acyl-sn-glycerol-3-phosphate acyltransferase [Pontibacillus sp. ALD_SL1]
MANVQRGVSVYRIASLLCLIWFRSLYRIRVEGEMPASGGVIICPNHQSLFDPPLLAAITRKNRQLYFMGKAELFQWKLFGAIWRSFGAFPVQRGRGGGSAMNEALSLLKEGKAVGVFPQGTRVKRGERGSVKTGAVRLSVDGNVPIVPVSIKTSYRFFSSIVIRFGKPYYPNPLETPRRNANVLMNKIQRMLE